MMSRVTYFRKAREVTFTGTTAFNPVGAYCARFIGTSTPILTLPDARTLKVDGYGYLWNDAATAIPVKDASGATVGTLTTGVPMELVLFDNSTLAGVWRLLTRAFL